MDAGVGVRGGTEVLEDVDKSKCPTKTDSRWTHNIHISIQSIDFKCLYFILLNYTLLQLFQFPPFCPPLPRTPHSLRPSPHHCSCPWVIYISSLAAPFPILYFTSPWLFCIYLLVLLTPLTHSPASFSHLVTIKTLSVSMILSLLFCLFSLFFRFS